MRADRYGIRDTHYASMLRSLPLSLLILAVSTMALAAPPTWKPDPKLLPKLVPETTLGSYRVRPPKGYSYQKGPARGGTAAHAWLSAPRVDGTRAYLMLVTVPVPASEAVPTAEQALEKLLGAIERQRRDWKRTKKENGTIGGRQFVRARWSGTERRTGHRMHGFLYVTVDGRTVVQLSSQDVEPHHPGTLALAEAAARTFRPAPSGRR